MTTLIQNTAEALERFRSTLTEKHMEYLSVARVPTGDGFFHHQIKTKSDEVFHLKFTRSPYKPKPSNRVSSGAKELDEKLKHALRVFGNGEESLIGINENIVLDLMQQTQTGNSVYFVTVVSDGRILWRSIDEFYNFVMRYDTFIKFAQANAPQAMVPTGWLLSWGEVRQAPPALADR